MQIVVNDSLRDAIEWTCKYANEYKVDIDIRVDADGEVSVSVCPTYRDRQDDPETFVADGIRYYKADTPQTETQTETQKSNDEFEMQTDCGWK